MPVMLPLLVPAPCKLSVPPLVARERAGVLPAAPEQGDGPADVGPDRALVDDGAALDVTGIPS